MTFDHTAKHWLRLCWLFLGVKSVVNVIIVMIVTHLLCPSRLLRAVHEEVIVHWLLICSETTLTHTLLRLQYTELVAVHHCHFKVSLLS